jgi:hypothetical protein
MPSLMELVERVNKGELIDPETLEVYEESPNSAEKFLAHHAHAMLDLRRAQQHMLQSLEAIEYSDQKVLNQFVSVSGFLGLTDMRAAPVIKFGSCAIARREYALGLEAIQNGVGYDLQHGGAYTSDRENCLFVATQYDRVSQSIGWRNDQPMDWNNKQTKIAYIVSAVADDELSSRTMASLARHHDSKRFKLQVYSTEVAARRERQQFAQTNYSLPSQRRGKDTIEILTRQKVSTWSAPLDGDILAAARELANQLIRDHIDVAIFDTTQADPIAAIIANWQDRSGEDQPQPPHAPVCSGNPVRLLTPTRPASKPTGRSGSGATSIRVHSRRDRLRRKPRSRAAAQRLWNSGERSRARHCGSRPGSHTFRGVCGYDGQRAAGAPAGDSAAGRLRRVELAEEAVRVGGREQTRRLRGRRKDLPAFPAHRGPVRRRVPCRWRSGRTPSDECRAPRRRRALGRCDRAITSG